MVHFPSIHLGVTSCPLPEMYQKTDPTLYPRWPFLLKIYFFNHQNFCFPMSYSFRLVAPCIEENNSYLYIHCFVSSKFVVPEKLLFVHIPIAKQCPIAHANFDYYPLLFTKKRAPFLYLSIILHFPIGSYVKTVLWWWPSWNSDRHKTLLWRINQGITHGKAEVLMIKKIYF
jgi:hypothetical protein